MRNIKINFAYDGSNFHGYQKQGKNRTIQNELEEKLEFILNHKIKTFVAGRTDRGVHAMNQVINFITFSPISLKGLLLRLRSIISSDIYICSVSEMPLNFHSRFSAIARSYVYKMKIKENFSIFERNYYNFINKDINVEKFNDIIKVLNGKHDFKSFCRRIKCNNTIREILDIKLIKNEKEYEFYIKANGFLRGMVRIIIASSMLEYFEERHRTGYILNKLKDPKYADEKLIVKAQGLYLYEIFY